VRAYDGSHAVTTATVELAQCGSIPPVDLVLSEGGSITGTARGGDGTPLWGAKITVLHRSIGFINTVSDSAGRFRFTRLPAGGVWMELAQGGQRTQRTVRVKDGQETHQDIQLFASGTGELRGRVLAGSRPLPGVRVLVTSFHGRAKGFDGYFPVTDASGSFALTGLPAGSYLVNVPSTTRGGSAHVTDGRIVNLNIDLGQSAHATAEGEEDVAPAPASDATRTTAN